MAYEFMEFKLKHPNLHRRRAWSWLCKIIEQRVEHMPVIADDAGDADLHRGDLVYFSGNNSVRRAIAGAGGAPDWAGVIVRSVHADGTVAPMRTDNIAYVRFEAALNPAAGEVAWVSTTNAGAATNVRPLAGGTFQSKVGVIVDASPYGVGSLYCWVLLNNCCMPTDQRG